MKFDLDHIYIEDACRDTPLARRVIARAASVAPVSFVADGRIAARPLADVADSFAAGKRRMVIMRRRSPFLMACPAGSAKFACCGYLVLTLASNCPMDCSYCFLQEYVADNPGFQVYANYEDAFDETRQAERERARASFPNRHRRAGRLARDGFADRPQHRPGELFRRARESHSRIQNQDRRNRKSADARSARPRAGFMDALAAPRVRGLRASHRFAVRSESQPRGVSSMRAIAWPSISIR